MLPYPWREDVTTDEAKVTTLAAFFAADLVRRGPPVDPFPGRFSFPSVPLFTVMEEDCIEGTGEINEGQKNVR